MKRITSIVSAAALLVANAAFLSSCEDSPLTAGKDYTMVVIAQPQTVNLVARLSQRHTEWAQQEVKPALGSWCDGYVTIRGAWCEPLNGELIRKLNRRLKEIKDGIGVSSK